VLTARLAKINGDTPEVATRGSNSIVSQLEGVNYLVKSVATREKKRESGRAVHHSTLATGSRRGNCASASSER
jgi:hypothetical protein